MRIVSLNVNGIRAAARKGFFDWLPRQRADVFCLQELRAQPEQIQDPVVVVRPPEHPGIEGERRQARPPGGPGRGAVPSPGPSLCHY